MKMDNEQLLEVLRRKEDAASAYVWGQLGQDREVAMREFHRMPYGTEQEGWSQIVASDVRDTVEWILPSLLKTFTATDKAVEFEPTKAEDVDGAEQATDACNYVFFKQNSGFMVLYNAIKDALIIRNCAVEWFKETKETVSSVPFKGATAEMLAMLTDEDGEITEATPAPMMDEQGQPVFDPMTGEPVITYSGRIKRIEKRQVVRVEAFSPEDLLIDREWTSPLLADCPYVARHRRVTCSDLKQMGYTVTAEELRDGGEQTNRSNLRNIGLDDTRDFGAMSDDDAMAEGWLKVEYMLVDFDGDGIAERRVIHRVHNKILKNEECADVPFATFSPRMNTHRWDGESMHDAVGDLQKIHSELLNQTFDNLKLTNNPRTKLLTDANGSPYANIDDLLDSRIGGIIRMQRADAVTEQVTPFAAGASFPMLEYIQGMRENRTGVSRTSQGMNPDSLNNTATGRQIDQTAAQQPLELIARIIAECLVKPIMSGILKLLTEGGMEKLAFRLRGEFVEYDPNEWRDSYDMTINVGLGSGDAQAKAAQLTNVYQMQTAGMQIGLATPKHIYHTASKIIENAGFKDVQNFIQDPETAPPKQEQPPLEVQLEQMKQSGDAQKFQAQTQMDMQKHQSELQHAKELEQLKAAAKLQEVRANLELQASNDQRDGEREAMKAQMTAQMESQRLEFDRWKVKVENEAKIAIAELAAQVKIGTLGDALTLSSDERRGELAALFSDVNQQLAGLLNSYQSEVSQHLSGISQGHQYLANAVTQMAADSQQPAMLIKDASGQTIGVQKGKNFKPVQRGPDGSIRGI